MRSALKEGVWLFLLTQVVIYVALAVNHLVLRFRSESGAWPASSELQTPWLVTAGSGLLLGAAALCLGQAARTGRTDQSASVRKWILLAATLCVLSLGSLRRDTQPCFARNLPSQPATDVV